MKTFTVHYTSLTEDGRLATFSHFIYAENHERAQQMCPPGFEVIGETVAIIDEKSGVKIDLDNLN